MGEGLLQVGSPVNDLRDLSVFTWPNVDGNAQDRVDLLIA